MLATCAALPDLHPDDRLLGEALARRGVAAGPRVWNDPGVDWGAARLTLIRSTWDYHLCLPGFLAWADGVSRTSRLVNPAAVVRWNTDKGYLRELAARGAREVPTEYLPAGSRQDLGALLLGKGWPKAVVKPAVSCDGWETLAVDADSPESLAAGQALLDRLAPERELMVQPYLPGVEDPGERSLIFIEGELSHAVGKLSPLLGGHGIGPAGGALTPDPDEVATARGALAASGLHPQLYARVDLVRDATGRPCLLELELVEPSLYLAAAPAALECLVDGVVARLDARA